MNFGWTPALWFWFGWLIPGSAVGAVWLGLKMGKRPGQCVAMGTLALLAMLAAACLLASGWNPASLLARWRQEFETSLHLTAEFYRQWGWPETEVQRALGMVRKVFWDGAVGWVIAAAMGFSLAVYGVFRTAAPKLPGAQMAWTPFRRWVVPDNVVWLLLAGLVLKLLSGRLPALYAWAGYNLLIVLACLYLTIGAAVVAYYLLRKQVPRLVKVLILAALALMPSLWLLLSLVGVLDTWWDWRRLKAEGRTA
ncbi:MAG: DUF2232 domain-containing protein [candidate division FCPU426 bacterium]